MKQKIQTKIKVFLVDDHPIVRDGVRTYLTSHAVAVVGEASDAKEALHKVKKAAPDIVVLAVNLPVMDGGELALRLRLLIPKAKLIAFSIHSSEEYVARMAQCGVQGYVTKDRPPAELLEAIKRVFQFERACNSCCYRKGTTRPSSTCSRAACIFSPAKA